MTLKRYLLMMLLATIACWLALASVMFYINPSEAGIIGFVLFYLSLLLSLIGTLSLVGFLFRVWLTTMPIFRQVIISFRQGILLAILFSVSLAMQSYQVLNWWIMLLMILAVVIIETAFSLGTKRI